MMKSMKQIQRESAAQPSIEYQDAARPRFGERLARNLALSGILVLAVVSVRNARLPSGQTVMTAVQEMIDPSWEDQLGKISFVGNFLPETMSVFFETPLDSRLTAPCIGPVQHAWTEQEPYLGYQSADGLVYAAAEGQVMSVSHGLDEERIVRVRHENGLETLYYNLRSVLVREGDPVTASTCLGQKLSGAQALIEVRRAGRPIDPGAMITQREEAP